MPCLRHYGGMRVTPMAMLGNLPVGGELSLALQRRLSEPVTAVI